MPSWSKQDIRNLLGGRCFYCGTYCEHPTIDHKQPKSRGGASNPSNLVPACKVCNQLKGTMNVEEFRNFMGNIFPLTLKGYGLEVYNNHVRFFGERNFVPPTKSFWRRLLESQSHFFNRALRGNRETAGNNRDGLLPMQQASGSPTRTEASSGDMSRAATAAV